MRHVVNFGLLFAFVALAATGVMAFVLPFSTVTARVHIVSGVAMILLVATHVAGRWSYFKSCAVKKKKSPLTRGTLLAVLGTAVGVVLLAIYALPPASWLVDQSYEARNRAQIVRASSLAGVEDVGARARLIVRDSETHAGMQLSVHMNFRAEDGSGSINSGSSDLVPAVAVWAETTNGTMIETLYLDQSLAFAEKVEWNGSLTQRDHILPIWRHRYTSISGVAPTGEVDATTGATDTHRFALDPYLVAGAGNKFVVCVEINPAGNAVEGSAGNSKASIQDAEPSLLYTALVKVDSGQRYKILELTAYGTPGKGQLKYDLAKVAGAKGVVDLLLCKLEGSTLPPGDKRDDR